ncbi:hypothetical protein C8R45DRAFT_972647, partial [Mycena sanguinolenta]
ILLCAMILALNLFFKLWPPVVACKTAGGPNLRTVKPIGHLDEIWAWTCCNINPHPLRSIKPRWITRHVAIGPRSVLTAEDPTLWRSHPEPFFCFFTSLHISFLYFSLFHVSSRSVC